VPILTKAFTGCQWGHDGPTEAASFYKLKEGQCLENGLPSSHLSGPGSERQELPGPNYLESIAKSHIQRGNPAFQNVQQKEPENDENFGDEEGPGPAVDKGPIKCGSWITLGGCENGHYFAKPVDCGREWCLRCRKSSHRRRMSRWFSKIKKIDVMGYLVITFPIEKRPRSQERLKRFAAAITRALINRGIKRGLRRWHWFGENSRLWNPHLNILIDEGYLSPEKLSSIKKTVQGLVGSKKIDVHYEYSQKIFKKIHWLKYITRPTFLDREWDEVMADEFFKFRNVWSWGKWNDDDKWQLPKSEEQLGYVAKFEKNICPVCGDKIHWCGVMPIDRFLELGYEQIWSEIWQLRAPPRQVILFEFFKIIQRGQSKENDKRPSLP